MELNILEYSIYMGLKNVTLPANGKLLHYVNTKRAEGKSIVNQMW